MSKKTAAPIALAIGSGLLGSLTLAQIAQANPVFHIASLASGQTPAASEGKCGEGTCSVAKMAKPGETAVAKADALEHGFSASQFVAWDKNGDGKLDAAELKAMHAAMDGKTMEGGCGANMKEGSCS